MKRLIAWTPVAGLVAGTAIMAFHPGVAIAEQRLTVPVPLAQGATYTIDEQHAGIYFEIEHLELSKVTGRFNKFNGKIYEHGPDLTKARVEFTAEAASIDTGIGLRDDHLRTADFFEVAKYPTLSFKSTEVVKKGRGYVATGDLTIKGKTKRIAIPFQHFGPKKMTVGEDATRIGIRCEPIVLRRSDFGVGAQFKLPDGTLGASDEVTVRISFEGLLDK
jgi:polyisoprenoid-binding protein YceI